MKRLVPALAAVVLVASCASGGGASPSTRASVAASTAPSAAPSSSTVPSTNPSTTPVPTVGGCPNREDGIFNTCLGWVTTGTYQTKTFHPSLTYLLPPGWGNLEDLPGNFLLLPVDATLAGVDAGTSDYLGVYASVAAASPCTGKPSTTVPQTWQGLIDWLTSDPALDVTNLKAVTVLGLQGDVMDIAMKNQQGDECSDGAYADVYVGVGQSSLVHSVGPNIPLRIYLLKHGADTLAIEIQDAPGGYYGDWPTTAAGVIAKFQIAP
jgi:hypothetical protein